MEGVVDPVGPPPQLLSRDTLVDGEDELCLFGEGYGPLDGGGPALGIVIEGAGEDLRRQLPQGRGLEYLLDAAADDISVDHHTLIAELHVVVEALAQPVHEL